MKPLTAEEFIKAKRPQDYDDIPLWHYEDMEEYASQFRLSKEKIVEVLVKTASGNPLLNHGVQIIYDFQFDAIASDLSALSSDNPKDSKFIKDLEILGSVPDNRDEIIQKQDDSIPLTKELLLKFHSDDEIEISGRFPNEITIYDRFLFIWKPEYKYWYVVTSYHKEYLTKIEFVHEYQDFIYTLTGEELKSKL